MVIFVTGFLLFLNLMVVAPALGQPAAKIPVLFDTDIGRDGEDPLALALLLASPEVELLGVTTVGSQADDRAWLVCRFLTQTGHKTIPVAYGRGEQFELPFDWQIQYRRHPAPIFNRTSKPAKEAAEAFLYQRLKESRTPVTIICSGPFTNLARLLTKYPDSKKLVKQIVVATAKQPLGTPADLVRSVEEGKILYDARIPLVTPAAPREPLVLDQVTLNRLFRPCTLLTLHLQSLHQLTEAPDVSLVEAFAVATAFRNELAFKKTSSAQERKQKLTEFVNWYVERVSAGKPALPQPPGNLSRLIVENRFPTRVHCTEDYETDIEKRWWMTGKLETKIVPPGRGRACRATLTQDFDDRQGNMQTMYNAVIFNPVPGPPMGKNPRLRFRYWLKGTDTLRVQIYSLTNGYHRYLSLKGLPQEKWQLATVDMTQVRRPDGTGGPLSENERIDDVQFIVDPRAELVIDDMVLYDAGPEDESRPFPDRIHFTGVFDSGKQGKEWPGDFDIVDKVGFFWRAARSRPNVEQPQHLLRLGLRGPRPLDETTRLFFRYQLNGGGERLKIMLRDSATGKAHVTTIRSLERFEWARLDLEMNIPGRRADEIIFQVPRGELLLDDVLLYTPGKE